MAFLGGFAYIGKNLATAPLFDSQRQVITLRVVRGLNHPDQIRNEAGNQAHLCFEGSKGLFEIFCAALSIDESNLTQHWLVLSEDSDLIC